jgi:wobble nucleotide-excising tRNase
LNPSPSPDIATYDLYVSIDDSMVDNYLKVFRAIFQKSEHIAHYKMMMGDAYVEVSA